MAQKAWHSFPSTKKTHIRTGTIRNDVFASSACLLLGNQQKFVEAVCVCASSLRGARRTACGVGRLDHKTERGLGAGATCLLKIRHADISENSSQVLCEFSAMSLTIILCEFLAKSLQIRCFCDHLVVIFHYQLVEISFRFSSIPLKQ